MKKTLGACVCALTLMGLVGQAEAAPISDWTLTVDSIELTIPADPAAGVSGGGSTVEWYSQLYGSDFKTASTGTDSDPLLTGSGTLTEDNPNTEAESSIGIDSIGSLSSALSPLGELYGVADAFDLFTLSFTFTLASADNSVDFGSLTYDFVFSSSYADGRETISIVGAGFQGQPTMLYKVDDYEYWIDGVDITNSLGLPITELVLNSNTIESSPFDFGATVDFGAKYVGNGNEPTATPEPATMLLMGLGLAGLGFVARRRNHK